MRSACCRLLSKPTLAIGSATNRNSHTMNPPGMNRRSLLKLAVVTASAGIAGHASLAEPVSPLQTELSFEAEVTIQPAVEIGPSSHGTRRYIPITGGTFSGPRIKGVVLPGGADWQTDRPDGVTELDALYSIKTHDGAVIMVRNRGLFVDGGAYFRTSPQFEAPKGPYDWLNKAIFVGSIAIPPHPGAVIIRVFKVL